MTSTGNNIIERGNIYWVSFDPSVGSETKKIRPAIVISNNVQNKISLRVIVVPITSNVKSIYPFESEVMVEGKRCKATLDQIRTVDKQRLKKLIGTCTNAEMSKLEQALKLVIGLD